MMLTKARVLAFLALLSILASLSHGEQAWSEPPSIIPDDSLQTQLTAFAESSSERVLNDRLEPFRTIAPEARTNVVLQAVLNASRRQGIDSFVPYFVVKAMGVTEEAFIRIIAPYASSEDPRLRHEIRERLSGADQPRQGGPPDFACYADIIREERTHPPIGLVEYMYDRSPASALSIMAAVYLSPSDAGKLRDDVATQDVRKALLAVSDRSEWWAHLYVAVMMEKDPSLRTPELLKKLEQDDNPLVREKVSKLQDSLQIK